MAEQPETTVPNNIDYSTIYRGVYAPVDVSGTAQTSATTPNTLEQQIREQWGQYGNWDVAGVNRAKELADLLALHGVTSLGDISLKTTETPWSDPGGWAQDTGVSGGMIWRDPTSGVHTSNQFTIGDKTLGFLGDYNLDSTYGSKAEQYLQGDNRVGWSARGEGNVSYNLKQDPQTGEYYIAPSWGTSSDAPDILPAIQLGLMFLPGLGQGLGALLGAGSGVGASMLGNAIIGGTMAELGGGDFLKGALGGGLGAGVGSLVQPIAGNIGSAIGQQAGSQTIGNIISGGITGAARAGTGALVSGQDFGDALIRGGLGGGISSGISSGVNAAFGDTAVPADAQKFIGSFMSSQLTPRVLDELGLGRSSGSRSSSSSRPSGSFRSSGGISPNDLTLLALMSQLQGQRPQQTQQVPGYSNAARSPFGSILE